MPRVDPPGYSSPDALTDLLFVYGTLRRGYDGRPAKRLAGESTFLGAAHITGYLFLIDDYPALIAEAGSDRVYGDLVRLHHPEGALVWLDHYEETGPSFPAPWEYRRQLLSVKANGKSLQAWVYTYNRPIAEKQRIISGDWLKR